MPDRPGGASVLALTFRPATTADLPALRALIESAYRGDSARRGWTHEADLIEDPRTSVAELEAILVKPHEYLLTAWLDGELVGSVQLTHRPPDNAYLGLLTVDPERQADGFGSRILTHSEQEAAQRFGARAMEMFVISTRTELIRFYERRGYQRTGATRPFPVPLDPPLVFDVLRKPLA